jgi:hypothetical protein
MGEKRKKTPSLEETFLACYNCVSQDSVSLNSLKDPQTSFAYKMNVKSKDGTSKAFRQPCHVVAYWCKHPNIYIAKEIKSSLEC